MLSTSQNLVVIYNHDSQSKNGAWNEALWLAVASHVNSFKEHNFSIAKLQFVYNTGTKLDTAKIDLKYRSQIGVPFTKDQKLYPVQPEGDTVRTAVMLHQKYRPNPVLEIVTN